MEARDSHYLDHGGVQCQCWRRPIQRAPGRIRSPAPTTTAFFGIRFESIGGLGAHLAGKILAEAGVLRQGLNGAHFSSYGSEKKGTPVKSFVRFCPGRPRGPHEQPDREPAGGRGLPRGAGPLDRRGRRPERNRHADREHALGPRRDPGGARPALRHGGGARRARHRARGEDAREHRDARRGRPHLPVPRPRRGEGDDPRDALRPLRAPRRGEPPHVRPRLPRAAAA